MLVEVDELARYQQRQLELRHDELAALLGKVAGLYDTVMRDAGALSTGGGNPGGAAKPESRMPVSDHVLTLTMSADAWAVWAVRQVNAHRLGPIDTRRRVDEGRPLWRPRATGTSAVMRELVEVVDDLAPDVEAADDVLRGLKRHERALERLAAPDGTRYVPVHVPCDHTVDTGLGDLGPNGEPVTLRRPCDGVYRARLEANGRLGVLVCTADPEHTKTQADHQAEQRRTPLNPAAVARLARQLTKG
jgi:hypothetical protein